MRVRTQIVRRLVSLLFPPTVRIIVSMFSAKEEQFEPGCCEKFKGSKDVGTADKHFAGQDRDETA